MQTNGARHALPMVALVGAVFLAGSAGGAVAGGLVTGVQIKNNSITSKDVRDGSLKVRDLSAATVARLRGAAGPAGPQGATGATGAPGVPGAAGVADFELIEASMDVVGGSAADLAADCPVGKTLIDVTGWWFTSGAAVQALPNSDATGGQVYTDGVPDDDVLSIAITCAVVDRVALPKGDRPRARKAE